MILLTYIIIFDIEYSIVFLKVNLIIIDLIITIVSLTYKPSKEIF